MQKISEFKGLNGNIIAFKDEVADAEKITFIGVPGVCTPFAELFAYAVRDKKSCFITLTDISSARLLEMTPQGMQLTGPADPHADVVALLGGLSMPKANVDVNELKSLIDQVLKDNGKLIGLCYMDMFKEAGWDELIDFDCIINGTLLGHVYK
ncbi:DUF2124 domain-containing protein [Methanobacterium alcaliphilum]|uniref:DUF2124 domain-containing protein n=1 Tax=Methanobacterium alcaliphilum TaxID=392018 RepID=UPI00200A513E|nr:DUF2124 domain-containing protein [Methanobacterium alcaliphilum]MCK9150686.1 DUF2124 domain-containing protein [Methanobacterium alcaliphilum]